MSHGKKKKGKKPRDAAGYAHNPRYCMILPDAGKAEGEDVVSTGQS